METADYAASLISPLRCSVVDGKDYIAGTADGAKEGGFVGS
jgi:hypothetical protein